MEKKDKEISQDGRVETLSSPPLMRAPKLLTICRITINEKDQNIPEKTYTNNELSEREIKETIPFTTAPKRIKYLGINLHKEVKTCTQKTGVH